MTDLATIQSWPREQLESALTQREGQLAKALKESDNWKQSFMDELAENRRLFDMLGLDKPEQFANDDSTTVVCKFVNEIIKERDQLKAELPSLAHVQDIYRIYDLQEEVANLKAQITAFHAAMQRERKPDWELSLKQLAAELDSASEYPPRAPKRIPEYLKRAARELRYMATSFTLKANFVPTDLEIKALKEQLESLEKRCAAMRDALEHCLEASSDPPRYGRYLTQEDRQIVKQSLSTTAGRTYKSPEEVAAIVTEHLDRALDWREKFKQAEAQLTAHTQALKVAKQLIEAPSFAYTASERAALLTTINNLLK